MPKLYSAFQDKKSIKNALSIFAVVAFEQVVTKYGINCRNALLWLVVPPCVIFGITLIKSKNVRLLFNRKTSKKRCLDAQMIGEGVAAFLYMIMPSVAWVIAAFLNSKIWVCYRAGYDECGIVRPCTKKEEYDYHIVQRDAKSEAQNLGLLMLTGAVITLAIITWGNHLLFARPVKERELDELVREAARSELERYVMSRAKDRLENVGKSHKSVDNGNSKETQPTDKEDSVDQKSAGGVNVDITDSKSQSEGTKHSAWLKTVDYKIDVFLDEFLSLDDVKMVYPEV